MSVGNKAENNIHANNMEEKLTDLLQNIPHAQDKSSQFIHQDVTISTRNFAGLHNKGIKDMK
ncbi:hypothetical protein CHS0354_026048 [Potamilus streckersoni]|uniref:Uncharacterized protein n=1 Tax=Potamilus streckersoni TaxID=2493646 RepID=A0AAE0SG25_9BIVA|nr:hypothetical protein CHS0354_026048 [Potamilus streckersoni]